MKVSRKSIVIGAAILAIGGAGLLYYLNSTNGENTGAWLSSDWLYRRSITLANNSGGTLSNEEVLVTVDTKTLIDDGKMQSDCDDLRFIDSDDSTYINYWIEGGCNTTATQVWVSVPSLPSDGKSVYIYYGNANASNAEVSWSNGKFLALSDTSCAGIWSAENSFTDKFIMGSTTFGTTGGTNTHNHGGTFSTSTGVAIGAVPGIVSSASSSIVNVFSTTDTETLTGTIESADSRPPYLTMDVCSTSKLTGLDSMVFISDSSVFTNWTRFSALDGYFPYGGSSYGVIGGAESHTHGFTNFATTGTPSLVSSTASATKSAIGTHTHSSVTITSNGAGSNYPEYKEVLYVKAPSGAVSMVESGAVISMANSVPPMGWTSYTSLNDVFAIGASAADSSTVYGSNTHTHAVLFTVNAQADSVGVANGSSNAASYTHTHIASFTTSSDNNIPEYVTTLYVKRKVSQTTTPQPEEIGNNYPDAPSSILIEDDTATNGIVSLTPTFSAIYTDDDAGDVATHYQIQVSTDSDFTNLMWDSEKTALASNLANGSRTPNITYAGSDLSYGTTYYFRMRFWDETDFISSEGYWSETIAFTTNYIPNTPASLLIEDKTSPTTVTLNPYFSAVFADTDPADTGAYYQIQVSRYSNFSNVLWDTNKTAFASAVTNGGRISNVSYTGNALIEGATYYWRIRMWDNNDIVSEWTSANEFIANHTPNAPTSLLTEDEVNPTRVTTTPWFSALFVDSDADDTAVYYQIQVNTASDFSGTTVWDSAKTIFATAIANGERSSDINYAGIDLKDGLTYYWKIRFWDNIGTVSPWSTIAEFNVGYAPEDLLVDGKENPTVLNSAIPVFSAVYSEPNLRPASYYEIEINTSADFTGTVLWDSDKTATSSVASDTRSPNYVYGGPALTSSGTLYYWRIRFWNDLDQISAWGVTATFVDNFSNLYLNGVSMEGLKIN